MFEMFKGALLELGPDPGFSFASEQVEGSNNVREVQDEFPVKVCESSEQLDSFDQGRGFPFFYGLQLLPVHLNFSLTDDHA